VNFLAPLFLLGALAVAAPVLFHLIRRTTRDKTPFSTLLFLQPDPPRLTKRSRIEHWLLLLLRAAALALLALAFARPFIRSTALPPDTSAAGRRLILLVDTSASMQRAGLWDAALDKSGAILRAAAPGDRIALRTFDSATRPLIDFAQWNALPAGNRAATALGLLTDLKPGWAGTGLSTALMRAAESLAEIPAAATAPGGEIILLSDLAEGSHRDGLQGWEWPTGVQVTVIPLTPKTPGNAGLQLSPDFAGVTSGEAPGARVRIWNAPDSATTDFQLGWSVADGSGFTGPAQDVPVPAGQSRIITLPWPAAPGPGRLLLRGDAEAFDNTLHALPPVTATIQLSYFGAESPTDAQQPLFFLNRALPQTTQLKVEVTSVAPATAPPVVRAGPAVMFIASGSPAPEQADFLHTQLTAGRTVLFSLTRLEAAPVLARLAGVPENTLQLTEVQPAVYGMLSQIDFQHPLFAPFADPRFNDFTKIHFWKYRRLAASALPRSRVLASFDSGDPALVEVPVGAGRLLVLTSGWHPADSQLALSSKFAPLLSSLLEWSGALITPPAQFPAGQPVALSLLGFDQTAVVTITSPDGSTAAATGVFEGALQPGIYTANSGSLTHLFAVNPDPAESRTAPMPSDELDRLGVPLKSSAAKAPNTPVQAALAAATETESRQKLWRWIIAAALAVLLIETWLAGLTARRVPAPGGPAR
jgi:Aerotolerance regulator N-terminal/von Willebrand factor type A domain